MSPVIGDCKLHVTVPRSSVTPKTCPADPPRGNPIYPLRAVKREVLDTGIKIGRESLRLTYDSSALIPQVFVGAMYTQGAVAEPDSKLTVTRALLGHGWSANLLDRLIQISSVNQNVGINPGGARASRGDGKSLVLSRDSAGQFTSEASVTDRLSSVSEGYRYQDLTAGALESYDSAGRPTSITWIDGDKLDLTYSNANTPVSVAPAPGYVIGASDTRGRSLSFTYVAPSGADLSNHLLKTVPAADGQGLTLTYDSSNRLTSVTWVDGRIRTFMYEIANSWALTGIVDENGTRYSTFGYDQGRAISSEHASGIGRVSVNYATPPHIQVAEQYDSAAQVAVRVKLVVA